MGTTLQHQAHPYQWPCGIWDSHITKYGTIQVPAAAADGTPPAIIKLHAKYQYRIVDFVIQEMGSEPNAPAATPQEGEVLKYERTLLFSPPINLGGPVGADPNFTAYSRHIFTKRGRYIFLKTTVVLQGSGLMSYPQQPYDDEGPLPSSPGTWLPYLVGTDTASAGADSTNAPSGGVDGSQIPSSGQELTIPSSGG